MNASQDAQQMITDRQRQLGALLAGILTLAGLAFLVFSLLVVIRQGGAMDISDRVMLPLSIVMVLENLTGYVLIRRGRHELGVWIVYLVSLVVFPIAATLVLRNVYLVTGLTVFLFNILLMREIFPASSKNRVSGFAALALVLIVGIEVWNPSFRVSSEFNAPIFGAGIMVLAGLGFMVYLMRRALGGNIRSKIISGILLTGIISLGVLTFFAFNRAGLLVSTLAERVETSVNLLAEEQLINKIFTEAEATNRFFEDIARQIQQLAGDRIALQNQQDILSQGSYWDAESKLISMDGGKYGNPATDVSSVFVPAAVELNESVIRELNTSAYLDFSTPQLLEEYPAILAVYFIDTRGLVRYYPNIELASLLPPDFDATERPYFEITSPLFNPQRTTRWTIPYVDAAGGGLVVTVAEPVYIRDRFSGVVAADVQLSTITEQISTIQVGSTGYAFMVDDAGRVISLPPAGYEMFGLDPNELPPDEYFKQTILGKASPELNAITNRMVAGGNGLNIVPVNGVDTYIAYTRIPANGYSIAIAVPVSELQTAIVLAQNEIETQTQTTVRTVVFILAVLLVGAIIVSLGLGQLIAAPILRLTQTANQILEGDLGAQAEVTTRDEVGTLAQAFNAMTSRLRATFEGLEQNIEERTAQLVEANARNERRARQFQSIAQVARTISSTLDLDSLLNQITTAISREFGFYHVGVFLLDTAGEYAVLSAANSLGGEVMLTRGHRLKVGEKGLVGFVASTGKARVALDTGADAVFFNNPDLPETRSEIALPLRAGERVIGVLDVQSTEPNAFTQEDIAIISTMADQVSIAIQNARQNEETKKALAESEALSRQFVQTGWSQFTRKQNLLGVRHTGAKATLLYSKNGKGRLADTDTAGTDPLKPKARGAVLSLPISLRGEVIGTVDVRAPDNRQWDQDEMDIVAAIIERAAIAMENSRLLAESQKRAAKERIIGEISARISAQSDVDELLKTAALELNRNLPGTDIAIQFRKEEDE
jgi:GAF domain-containing protein/HAMP domain-containing protein